MYHARRRGAACHWQQALPPFGDGCCRRPPTASSRALELHLEQACLLKDSTGGTQQVGVKLLPEARRPPVSQEHRSRGVWQAGGLPIVPGSGGHHPPRGRASGWQHTLRGCGGLESRLKCAVGGAAHSARLYRCGARGARFGSNRGRMLNAPICECTQGSCGGCDARFEHR